VNIDLLRQLAVWIPVLLISVIAHEIAHGYAALKQGDTTARDLGRLSWNPVRHIDPFLTILLPAMMLYTTGAALGGAKPVPVNPRNYRELRKGDIIVSLAGVVTNFGIAVVSAVLIVAIGILAPVLPMAAPVLGYLQALAFYAVLLNWILIVFNLLPIPPLDGSHVMKYLLPPAIAVKYVEYGSRFGFLILIGLIIFWRDGVSTLLYPAIVATDLFHTPTRPFWIPEAQAWFR
jgi:Zn-dependent protease